jgi:hypothetical protein
MASLIGEQGRHKGGAATTAVSPGFVPTRRKHGCVDCRQYSARFGDAVGVDGAVIAGREAGDFVWIAGEGHAACSDFRGHYAAKSWVPKAKPGLGLRDRISRRA